jgi:hypothetical protein
MAENGQVIREVDGWSVGEHIDDLAAYAMAQGPRATTFMRYGSARALRAGTKSEMRGQTSLSAGSPISRKHLDWIV